MEPKAKPAGTVVVAAAPSMVTMVGLASPALAEDTMKVGITTTGVPFTFIDTSTLKPTGAMVDLASEIAAGNGMRSEFQISAFPALIPALTTGKIDLICFPKDYERLAAKLPPARA